MTDEIGGRRYVDWLCTLDGELAVIVGRQNAFATIGQVRTGFTVEFAWETVDRIMSAAVANKTTAEFKSGQLGGGANAAPPPLPGDSSTAGQPATSPDLPKSSKEDRSTAGRIGVPDLSGLQDDGDTLDLGDGRTLRLRIEPDFIDPFVEYETYGKVQVADNRSGGRYATRPKGFDGNSEKLHIGNNGPFWWQPPDDVKRTDDGFRKLRSLVIDLLERGMYVVLLEVLQGTDAYRRPIVVSVASLGGIDSLHNGYLAEVLGDLYAEVQA